MDNKNINTITEEERELIQGSAREKNNIYIVEKQFKKNITEMMKTIFKNKETIQNFNELNNSENVEFELVTKENCPQRQITEEEFDAVKDTYKNEKNVFFKAFLSNIIFEIVFVAFLIFYIVTFKAEKTLLISLILLGTVICTFIPMFILLKSHIKEEKSKIIYKNSKISVGNVIQFRYVPSKSSKMSAVSYYIDVAFYDEKKYVKRILCSKKIYDMLSLDSKVIIHNSRIYVYDKNNNITC